jgi:hypothetical protein
MSLCITVSDILCVILLHKIVFCKEITSDDINTRCDIIQVLTFFIFTVTICIPLKGRRVECACLLSHEIRDCFLDYPLRFKKKHLTLYYSYNSLTLFLTTEISLQICDKSLFLWIYCVVNSKCTSNPSSSVNHMRANVFELLPSINGLVTNKNSLTFALDS